MKRPDYFVGKFATRIARRGSPDRRIIARGVTCDDSGVIRRVEFHATKGWRIYRLDPDALRTALRKTTA